MNTRQWISRSGGLAVEAQEELRALAPQLVLVFAAPGRLDEALVAGLKASAPEALLVGCTTCGEVSGGGVERGSVVVTAVHFDAPGLHGASTDLAGMDDSRDAGRRLGAALARPGLHGVLVFGPGVAIDGSALVAGLAETLGPAVPISGGLAGDEGAFVRTEVLYDGRISDHLVAAVAFDGPRTLLAHGSFGGWQPFGHARRVTRCEGNVLYELDGAPALEVYRKYLGDHASELPASGLLFPFAMLDAQADQTGLIRTILGVDAERGSLVLAGGVADDGFVRLMHASTEALVDGAEVAAKTANVSVPVGTAPGLALLVSCVGRRLVMGARVDEEVEAVGAVFGAGSTLAGFYSHGEIGPVRGVAGSRLHNQTMTVTWIGEA